MKGNIFLLEDDAAISGLVKVALEMNGSKVTVFSTVQAFEDALLSVRPDVALFDVMLPDGSGLDALCRLKRRYPGVSCIVLTALGKEEDKVAGLNLGADDYVTKPFSVLELTARVNASLRRIPAAETVTVGDLTLDLPSMTATRAGVPLPLNRKEYELLKYFMENAGKVLPREKLLNAVWGYDAGETRTLDNHVSRLRKLGVAITTVFGVGYKL